VAQRLSSRSILGRSRDSRLSSSAENSGVDQQPAVDESPATAVVAALRWLAQARRILVFTGAGISTESGIPDFRGPNGIWKTTDPQRFTIESYVRDRAVRVERWQARLESRYSEAEPNAAHLATTRLQRAGLVQAVVTQNIDGLHQKAGAVNVIELHGTTSEAICLQCSRRMPIGVALDRVREGDEDPHCELCGGLLKTATISFGQPLIAADMDRAVEEARLADVCLTVGSTLSVWPAAAVPVETVRHGGRLVIVNEGATDLDGMATVLISGRAGTVLPELADAILGGADSR
jgi:NAD-dependent deacetylase